MGNTIGVWKGDKPQQNDLNKVQMQPVSSSSYLRSTVQYNAISSNFDERNLKRDESNGKSLLCGPVDKMEQCRRLKMLKEDMLKFNSGKRSNSQQRLSKNRKLIIMRHGERMDRVFIGWQKISFAEKAMYKPYDLNMPVNVPLRADINDFAVDSPLTELGDVISRMVGRCMRMSYQTVNEIYCSPALRCIQSAHHIQKSCRRDHRCKINIEPGLFEFLGWYDTELPEWMTIKELISYGYNINQLYEPIINEDDMKNKHRSESVADYYQRSHSVVQSILKNSTSANTIIFIIAHAPSVDACSRGLLRRPLSLPDSFDAKIIGDSYPYCCVLSLQENDDESWTALDRTLPNITYYEYNNLIDSKSFNRR